MSLHRYLDVEYVISKPFLVSCHQYGHWAAKGERRACVCACVRAVPPDGISSCVNSKEMPSIFTWNENVKWRQLHSIMSAHKHMQMYGRRREWICTGTQLPREREQTHERRHTQTEQGQTH